VDYLKQFVIPFHGLKVGKHHYEYNIDNEFFEYFEYAEFAEGSFRIEIVLEKQERMLELDFSIKGEAKLLCDRCAGEYMQDVQGSNRLIVKFGSEEQEISDEILVIPESKHHLDISPFIYEYIILHLPYKRLHPQGEKGESTCDPEMIRLLEAKAKTASADPRWDELKKIKFKTK
jgi:uncharacterized metal-binding protein YceD (DUF177 family)